MARIDRLLRSGGVIPLGCALAVLWPSAVNAQAEVAPGLADNLEFSADIRTVLVNGERSWTRGDFGKLRSGSEGDWRAEPQLGNASLVWKPELSWSLGATIVGTVEGGERTQAGLSQAYLSFRPMRSSNISFSARAGLMWPPVSLEHEGSDWHVRDSITPSAINSWIGEEVKPLAVEATIAAHVGGHQVRATAALIAANDTAGTLLTFRGWALHDRTTLAFNRQPLPPLGEFSGLQANYTHPLLDIHRGFGKRIGYYAKLGWQPPVPVRVEIFHYDNAADPQDVTPVGPEWGWRTRFDNLGIVANLGSDTFFKSQALRGKTRMGFPMPIARWVDERFRSAYALLGHSLGKITVTARGDLFDTHGNGSIWTNEYREHGWAAMLVAKRDWKHVTGFIEFLHVWSNSPARDHIGEADRQPQTQLQVDVRMHW